MKSKVILAQTLYVPDVLETLAQLPNDEVFTPPKLANAMLDLLPEEVWSNPEFRWLDPATKSGVFLREIAKRLMVGLAGWEPNARLRRSHILTTMLHGAAITKISGDIARRSLYQTKDATGAGITDEFLLDLIVAMDTPDGNVAFVPTEHSIVKGRCLTCRAPESLIRDRREHFAYSFIHGTYPTEEMRNMKFDVIVGNPPYQIGMDDGEGNRTANITPLYNMFVEKAMALDPRYLLMITPSRWFAGGHSLSDYRDRMISDRRLRVLVDNPKIYDCFPGAKIRGGVSYFLWDREWSGDCAFSTRIDGVTISTASRDLRDGAGVLIRDNFAAGIVEKISNGPMGKGSLADVVSSSDPFGQSIKTNFKGAKNERFEGAIPLVFINKIGYIRRDQLERNHNWVDQWKVLIPKASSGDTAQDEKGRIIDVVLGEPLAVAPGSASTQSYLVAGRFDTRAETENYAHYLATKFVRFLVLQRKISQDLTPTRFRFVPNLDMAQRWSDEALYDRFSLNEDEIAYIETSIKPRSMNLSLDSPIPATHLPGGRKFRHAATPDALENDDE